jgi:hypothetical protein
MHVLSHIEQPIRHLSQHSQGTAKSKSSYRTVRGFTNTARFGLVRLTRRTRAPGPNPEADYRVSTAMMTSPAGTPAIADSMSHAAGFARLKVQPTPNRELTMSAGSSRLT